jgi:ABC-type branched-subunit amino acid transport system permease subunit
MTTAARRWGLFLIAVLAVAGGPLIVPHPFLFSLFAQALIWILVAASWDLLAGYAGQLSFSHAGFFALGAYTAAGLALHLQLSPWLGLLGGTLLSAVLGFAIGLPALRLRGHYLAVVTFGFSEIVRLVAQNWLAVTGGPFGMHDFGSFPGLPADELGRYEMTYFIVLGVVAPAIALMLAVCEHTNAGRAFRAIREDEILAQSHGINIKVVKVGVFVLSAALTGLGGGLFAFSIGLVNPNVAAATTSALVVGMAVFGGLGTIWGPAIGAVVLFLMSEGLRLVGVVYNLVAVGFVIIVFVILLPRGIAGLLVGARGPAPPTLRRVQESRAVRL